MPVRLEFDWDDARPARNFAKHDVRFADATRVFLDGRLVEIDVTRAVEGEARRKVIDRIDGRVFAVVYTERGRAARLISARRCNDKEARLYGPL